MKPQSIFAATFFEGQSDYEGNQWAAHADYTLQKIQALAGEQGLILRPIEWDHQELQRWILFLRRDTTVELPDFNATARIIQLESQLAQAKRQLKSIRSHPYMRVGYKLKFSFITMQFALRRLRRTLLGR